ncbi:MAG: hypothetical protein PF488_01855 [Patescibacteria group bacterium]|jgi:MFS family permease|nr:hypothetical protein [Patescibacteria group bacterium]
MSEQNEEQKEENKEEKFSKPKLNSATKVFKESVSEWWKNIKGFLVIYGWSILYSLAFVVGALIIGLLLQLTGDNLIVKIITMLLVMVAGIASIYFLIKASVAFILYIKNNYKDDPKNLFLKESDKYFLPYLGVSVLTFILVLLWSLLLIIPGIIFSIFYTFATYIVICEDKKGMKAIKRSKELVKSYFWPVTGRILLIALVFIGASYVLAIPMIVSGEGTPFYEIWEVVVNIFSMLIAPLSLIYFYKVYKNLVKIKG